MRIKGLTGLFMSLAALLLLAIPASAGTFHMSAKGGTGISGIFQNVNSGPGNWTFVYTVKGQVSSLLIKIKNSTGASDNCWMYYTKHPTNGTQTAQDMPAATSGVCGPDWPDLNGDPLTVTVNVTGGSNSDVEIDVIYPDPAP